MAHFTVHPKGWCVAISVLVLLVAANAPSYGQITKTNCGGREERACGVSDAGYSENNDYAYTTSHDMPCDYGLVVDQNGFCQNSTVQHFVSTGTSMLGRQILAQEYSIGADTPINWLSLMGTHNSFSSWNQGAESKFVADQQWSLTDQLQAGARTLMLDVHHYDGEMRLCHWSLGDDGDFCPDYQDGRLYVFAIKEIAYWLKHNPGEVVILRLNNTVDDKWDFLLDGPIKEYFGDLAFTPDNFTGGIWPTMRQLRTQGKQIVVIGNNSTQWIHSWSRYVLNDAQPNTKGLDQCHNGDGLDVRTRKYNQFAYIAEDRSQSTAYQGGLTGDLDPYLFPLLDSCGFSFIDVDFLYSLSRAYIHPQSDDRDARPQASVWSLAPGVPPETELPMVMANLKMKPGEKTDVHPFACAGPGIGADQGAFPAVYYPASHLWKFTKAADGWKNGEAACQNEFGSTYHFWAPATGIEYGALVAQVASSFETAPFWVNYFGGPVLNGTPNTLTLKWNKTQAFPSAQKMILRGGLGGALTAVADDTSQSRFFSSDNVSMVNANTVSVGFNYQLSASLPIGTYTQTLRVDEVDPATGQVNSTRFPITLQVSDTLLLGSSMVTLGNCTGPQSAHVVVKSGGEFTLEPSDPWIHVTADRLTAPATLTITVDASGLSAGQHSGYIKVVAPKATNGGAVLQVNLLVSPQMSISSVPGVAVVPFTVDGTQVSGSQTFCWASGSVHTVSALANQMLGTGSRAQFQSWSDGGAATHTVVQSNAASALTANFDVQYLVKASVNHPGYGSIDPSPSSGSGWYNLGTIVTFTAKPRPGYSFADFVFNGTPTSSNPLALQITVPVIVLAEFQ